MVHLVAEPPTEIDLRLLPQIRKVVSERSLHTSMEQLRIHYDAFPVRATKDTIRVLEDLSAAGRLVLIDTEKVLLAEVPEGILGEPVVARQCPFFDPRPRLARLGARGENGFEELDCPGRGVAF